MATYTEKYKATYTEKYKGFTIEIHNDEDMESPREWDNLGTMVCFHRRYNLGDKTMMNVEEAKAFVERKDVISLPLYLYDHSGITMNTTGFSCPWDSGQVGYIYVTKDKIRKEFSVKNVTKKLIEKVLKSLRAEVAVYDQYLVGDVYGYSILGEDDEVLDACCGFYGTYDDKDYSALTEARKAVDHIRWRTW